MTSRAKGSESLPRVGQSPRANARARGHDHPRPERNSTKRPQRTSVTSSPESFRSRGSRAVGAISLKVSENSCNRRLMVWTPAYSAGAKKVSLKAAKETAAEYDDSTRLSNQASSAPHPQKKPGLAASAMLADSAWAKKISLKTTEETAAECDDSPRMSNQASSAPRPQKKPALIAGATLASLLSLSFVYLHVLSGQSIKQTVLSGQAREQTVRPIQIVKQIADLGVRADPAAMPPPVTPLTPDPVERQPSPAAGAAVDEAPKGSIPGLVALPEMRIVPVLGPVPVSVASHEQTATPAPTKRRRIITPVRKPRPVVVSSGRCYMWLPPFFHGTPDTSAPLYQWKQSGEFRSAASCERFRRQAISDTVDERDEDTTKFKSLYDDRIKLFTVASCLSPRDPRMKEVQ